MKNLFVLLAGAAAFGQNVPASILARNMGSPEDQTTAFPPHKIIGNVYYVGTKTLSSFLIVTPRGNILIDSLTETIWKVTRSSRNSPAHR
jgi:hypothetical protein